MAAAAADAAVAAAAGSPLLRELLELEAHEDGVERFGTVKSDRGAGGVRLVSRAVYAGLRGVGKGRKTCQDMVHVQRLDVGAGGAAPRGAYGRRAAAKEPAAADWLLVCLCDGHGEFGDKVAGLLRGLLPPLLQAEVRRKGLKKRHVKSAFRSAFRALQEAVRAAADAVELEYSGATATVLLLNAEGTKVHVAAIGDSRAVLGTSPGGAARVEYELLTHDHTFDDPSERVRARRNGGVVQQANGVGPLRLYEPGTNGPGLAVSRSFADTAAHRVGVTAEPEVKQFNVDAASHRFVVLASDGVWDKFGNQEVVEFVAREDPGTAAKLLVEAAAARWITQNGGRSDDVSCAILYLAPPGDARSRAAEAEADDVAPPPA